MLKKGEGRAKGLNLRLAAQDQQRDILLMSLPKPNHLSSFRTRSKPSSEVVNAG